VFLRKALRPLTNKTENATCEITSTDPNHPNVRPWTRAGFNEALYPSAVTREAGTKPNTTPVISATPAVKSKTRGSGRTSNSSGSPHLDDKRSIRSRSPAYANTIPKIAPSHASITPSVSSCRTKPPTSRADRDAHAHFSRSRGGPRQQQISDICARQQKHDPTPAINTVSGRLNVFRIDIHPVPPGVSSIVDARMALRTAAELTEVTICFVICEVCETNCAQWCAISRQLFPSFELRWPS